MEGGIFYSVRPAGCLIKIDNSYGYYSARGPSQKKLKKRKSRQNKDPLPSAGHFPGWEFSP